MPRSGVHGSRSVWKDRSDVQRGIVKEMGEKEKFTFFNAAYLFLGESGTDPLTFRFH